MIISKFPSRISLAGGSTDQEEFLSTFGRGMVINFPANIFNKIIIDQDRLGKNIYDGKYVIIYSQREECDTIDEVRNDIVKHSLLGSSNSQKFTAIFLSDINSVGSGLACSSAYTLAFNRSMEVLCNSHVNAYDRCIKAFNIERKFNPLLGMQDTFGCGLPGLKVLHFKKDEYPSIETIKTSVFEELDMYIIYTGITRKSTNILKTLSFKDDSLLKICEKFLDAITKNNVGLFLDLIKQGWTAKKNTSKSIIEEPAVFSLDNSLENNENVLAHRLCGAGNGGYFLSFVKKGIVPKYNNSLKINPLDSFHDIDVL